MSELISTEGQEEVVAPTEETVTPSWYYSAPNEEEGNKGVAGNGEVPEWFKVDKFKSLEDQAKSYTELEKRFGGFAGAPEEYALPDEINADALDDGMLDIAKEIGKESNMSQETFNQLVSRVSDYQMKQSEAQIEQALKDLGDNAQARVQEVQNWLNMNAPKEVIEAIAPMTNTADSIKALEFFIGKSKNSNLANDKAASTQNVSEAEFAEMLMAKDKYGNLKVSVDRDYKAKMDKLTAERIKSV